MTETKTQKLIHLGKIAKPLGRATYLLLRQQGDQLFSWFEWHIAGEEKEAGLSAETVEDALRLANKKWALEGYRTINCGFRYTLPERDEHGINALFHQMVASYSSSNGVYFDEELGNNCFVQFASEEARSLWKTLQQANRL
jgi:hypothetical protein